VSGIALRSKPRSSRPGFFLGDCEATAQSDTAAMIEALLILLFCQLLGEALVHALALPLPGPVAGMMLLFLALLWRGRKTPGEAHVPEPLADTTDALLRNLSLLFIPAAVGIVQHTGILRESAVSPPGSRRTESARRVRSRSIRWPARLPALRSDSTARSPRSCCRSCCRRCLRSSMRSAAEGRGVAKPNQGRQSRMRGFDGRT
jgi:holin-like protein